MKEIIDNFNSKKLAGLAGIVAAILNSGASPEWTVAALAGSAIGYFLSDAWQNRASMVAAGTAAGLEFAKKSQEEAK